MSIINEITLYQMEIPFNFSFGHGSAKRKTSDSFVLVLKTNDGKIGIGEGLPRVYVTGETLDSSTDFFKNNICLNLIQKKDLTGQLEGISSDNLIEKVNQIYFKDIDFHPTISETFHSIRCATELALLDLFLQESKNCLSDLLPFVGSSNYSCILPFVPMKYLKLILWAIRISGFNQVKVKTNGKDDEERLKMIRNTLGNEVEVRIDGNSIYDYHSFKEKLPLFKRHNIKWIEQPFLKENHNQIVTQFSQRDIPLMADESLCNFEDADLIVEKKYFDLFNIRISKNGGLYNSLKLVELARKNDLDYQLGAQVGETAILSNVGRFLGYHISPIALEGSAGTLLLKRDISKENIRFKIGGGAKIFKGSKNFGLTIKEDYLSKYGKKVFYKSI